MSSASGSRGVTFETGHEEMIHDVQFDYYGKRLATASSDRSVRIFGLSVERPVLLATLTAHDGPVWQVAWAHPKFGTLLASCSYDGRLMCWKETSNNQWTKIYEFARLDSSMNAIAFAPHTFGLSIACACSDGTVTVCSRSDTTGRFENAYSFLAHTGGVNSISWGPDLATGALLAPASALGTMQIQRRFVTGGCDNLLKIWKQNDDGSWTESPLASSPADQHKDWVRDVAWCPSLGLPCNTIASASEDKTVALWYENVDGSWRRHATLKFECGVWRVSWSVNGNILAVSQGDQKVSLWKEGTDGNWSQVSTIADNEESRSS